MASLGGPHSRRCARFASSGIDVGAGVNEEFACGVLVIDSGPLGIVRQRAHIPQITSPGHTWRGVIPSASLYCALNFPDSNIFRKSPISPNRAHCMMSPSREMAGELAEPFWTWLSSTYSTAIPGDAAGECSWELAWETVCPGSAEAARDGEAMLIWAGGWKEAKRP